jgi:transcriptional regulator with XRE-family HTH domain
MKAVKDLRKLKGWNQSMLAEAAGLEQSTISKIERGWDGATIRTINQIATALDVPVFKLFLDNTDAAELRLLNVFRSLPDDRKQGWLDMAQAVSTQPQTVEE